MAYNKGLLQQDKDRINQGIRELAAQGKSEQEILAWRDAQVEAAIAAAESGKPTPPVAEAPTGGGDSISDDTSSGFKPQSYEEYAQTAGKKKVRVDDEGEVVNLAQDFGELGAIVESIPFIGDLVDDIYGAVKSGYAQGDTVDNALELFAKGADASEEDIQKYIEVVNAQRNVPVSAEMQDFNDTYEAAGGGAWGFVKAIAQNPSVAATTAVSSMIAMINPASAAGAALGGGGGAAVGAGFAGIGAIPGAIGGAFAGAGGILETGTSFTEFLQEELAEKGLEFNEEGVAAVLEDPEAMLRIRGKSAARGGVIAVIDGLTAGVASTAAKGVAKTAKNAAKLKGVLAATAIEGAGGGVGEAIARGIVGQELDAREIGLEIVGEFGTGVTLGKAAVETQPSYKINGERVNRAQIEAIIKEDPAILSTVEVKNDPELKAIVNERVTGLKSINKNVDVITKEESVARASHIEAIANARKEQRGLKKSDPQYQAWESVIRKEKEGLKLLVDEQNKAYTGLTNEELDILRNSEAELANFDKAIENIQNKYKEGETPSAADQANIKTFQELKQEAVEGVAEIRAKGRQQAEERAAAAAVAQQTEQKQQELEAQAEEAGVDISAIEESKANIEETINDDIDTNTKAIDNVADELIDLGVDVIPVQGTIDPAKAESYIPLTKDTDQFTLGDFEKKIESYEPRPLAEVKKAEQALKRLGKDQGFIVETNLEKLPDGTAILTGGIRSPKRDVALSEQFAPEAPAPVQEEVVAEGPEVNEFGNVVGERVLDEETGIRRTALSDEARATPIDAIAEEYNAEKVGENQFIPENPHRFINRMAQSGHRVDIDPETGIATVFPGEGPQFSASEEVSAPETFVQHNDLGESVGNRIKLNIGLENNPQSYDQIIETLQSNPDIILGSTERVDGEYNGQPERTLVVNAKYKGPAKDFRRYIEGLNQELTQEAIGAQFNNRGSLIYDPNFTGERYQFDKQYFIEPSKSTQTAGVGYEVPAESRRPEVLKKQSEEFGRRDYTDVNRAIQESAPRERKGPGVIQETTPAPRGEEVERTEPGRFTEENPYQPKGLAAEKGKITDSVIDKWLEGDADQAIVASIPYARRLANSNKRDRDKATPQELESVALEAVTTAFKNGEYLGRKFNPQNADEAIKMLGGIVKDAVRDYTLGEGAPAGIRKLSKDATTRLNKINAAVRRLGNNDPVAIAQALNEGFTAIDEKRLPGHIQVGAGRKGETAVYHGPRESQVRGRSKSRFIQDKNVTPQQVNDLLATQSGLTPHRIDVSPFDTIAPEVAQGFEQGGSVADVLGVDIDNLPQANRDIIRTLSAKEIEAKLPEIIRAISPDRDTQQDIKKYLDRHVLNQVEKGRKLRDFAAKLLSTERDTVGKTLGAATPSAQFSLAERQQREEDQAVDVIDTHGDTESEAVAKVKSAIAKMKALNDYVVLKDGKASLNTPAVNAAIKEAGKKSRQARLGNRPNRGRRIIYNPGAIANYSVLEDVAKPPSKADMKTTNEIIQHLQSVYPGTEVVTDVERILSEVPGFTNQHKGALYAGKVYLNPNRITQDTALHEFTHMFMDDVAIFNRPFFEAGKKLFFGSKLARDTKQRYPDIKGDAFWKEVLTNAIGKHGTKLFTDKKKQGLWQNWFNRFSDYIKNKLGIRSREDYSKLKVKDWLDVAAHGALTGNVDIFNDTTEAKPQFSLDENPDIDDDAVIAKRLGEKVDWRKILGIKVPKNFISWLVPPAADDFHGLIGKIDTKGKNRVRDAFIKNHHEYIRRSDDLRSKVKTLRNALGRSVLNDKNIKHQGRLGTIELTGAQAIQAIVDGYSSPGLDAFAQRADVQRYIKGMEGLGLLQPSKGNRTYLEATPDYDLVNYIINDLRRDAFQEFNDVREQVFNKDELLRLQANYGNNYIKALNNSLQRMSTGKTATGVMDDTTRKWNDWAQGSVGTIMFLNFRSAALQLLSVGNYGFSNQINSAKFIGELAKGFARLPFDLANKNSGLRKRLDSAYLRERRARAGFDVNMQELADSIQGSKNFGEITKKILNFGFKATSAVDSLAIALGGEAFVNSGGTEAQWIEQSEEAQQSSRPDRVSQWQTTGISKFVLAFANTPAQYFRLGQKALRTIRDPKSTTKDKLGAASKVLWYMAAQNAIFVALQSASHGIFDDEEEEVKAAYNSMADSLLRGMGLYGAVISSLKNVLVEADRQSEKSNPDYVNAVLKATTISPPLNKKINDLLAIGRGYNYQREDRHVTAVAKGIAVTTNLPADWAQKKFNAAAELWQDNYGPWQKFLMFLGYSPYALDKEKEEEGRFGGGRDFKTREFGGREFNSRQF